MIKKSTTIDGPVNTRNRRIEPRFSTNQTAMVTLSDSPLHETIQGTIIDYLACGIALLLPVFILVEGQRAANQMAAWQSFGRGQELPQNGWSKYRLGLKLRRLDHRADSSLSPVYGLEAHIPRSC